MYAWQLEQFVFDVEGIRLIIRLPWNAEVGEYAYQRRAAGNTSVTEWLNLRIAPLIGGAGTVVVDGSGRVPHGRSHLDTVRNSYTV